MLFIYLTEFGIEGRLFESTVHGQRNNQQLLSVSQMSERCQQVLSDLQTTENEACMDETLSPN